MISFPPSKINLGLNILEKRADGFHNLESVFYPIPLCDALEVILDPTSPQGSLVFRTSGLPIPGDESGNLIIKAHRLFNEKIPLPALKVHLHKVVPMGGGLGGGSSNGTWMLRTLNNLMGEPFSLVSLRGMAESLGSDCPYFLYDEPCLVKGRGELLKPFSINLGGWHFVLLNPGVHVSTKEAFSMIKPQLPSHSVEAVLQDNPDHWSGRLINDFENGVAHRFPQIANCINLLRNAGASYVSMTGTGASVYGLFRNKPNIQAQTGLFCYQCVL
jgi:4-diphosphocytidyl-2-C-methyl-D-erythritol kinase